MTLLRPVVIIESPYRGNRALNAAYLEACIRHSVLFWNEAPIASHKLYTSALDDNNAEERAIGMQNILSLYPVVSLVAVYYDLGVSEGMQWGMVQALRSDKKIEPRSLYNHPIPREWDAILKQVRKAAVS